MHAISRPFWTNIVEIDEELRKNVFLAKIVEDLKQNLDSHRYSLEQSILLEIPHRLEIRAFHSI